MHTVTIAFHRICEPLPARFSASRKASGRNASRTLPFRKAVRLADRHICRRRPNGRLNSEGLGLIRSATECHLLSAQVFPFDRPSHHNAQSTMMTSPRTAVRVICQQYSLDSTYWCAWNEDAPFARSSGDHPADAVRRFFESHGDGEVAFELVCDQDLVGNGRHMCHGHWRPPELFLECEECRGTGTYVGLNSVQACQVCSGRGEHRVRG
jgi:hypothetical protein